MPSTPRPPTDNARQISRLRRDHDLALAMRDGDATRLAERETRRRVLASCLERLGAPQADVVAAALIRGIGASMSGSERLG